MLDVEWTTQAVKQLKNLEKPQRTEIKQAVEELAKQQFSHPQIKPIKYKDEWIWRLKVKRQHTDHRIFIDLQNNKFRILDLDHRDTAYQS